MIAGWLVGRRLRRDIRRAQAAADRREFDRRTQAAAMDVPLVQSRCAACGGDLLAVEGEADPMCAPACPIRRRG